MPLTRNLYELSEVTSALQTCLYKGWSRALFWAWELVISDEPDLARQTIIDTWLSWGAPYDPGLATDLKTCPWVEAVLRTFEACREAQFGRKPNFDIVNEAAAMPARKRMTLSTQRLRTLQRRAKRSAAFVAAMDPAESLSADDAARWWISLDSAMRRGYRIDACWLLQAVQPMISADTIWTALKIASRGGPPTLACIQSFERAATAHPTNQLLHQAAAVSLLCMPTKERAKLLEPKPAKQYGIWERDWATWTAEAGQRRARKHAIPVEALHAGTTRGSLSSQFTNIDEIRDPVAFLTEGCAWWRAAVAAGRLTADSETGATFPDDDALESFYNHHFPDDIPDEWSAADQQKSHGVGCAETAPMEPIVNVRMEPVSDVAWAWGIHVPGVKKLKPPAGQAPVTPGTIKTLGPLFRKT